jgi:hypothetical protein
MFSTMPPCDLNPTKTPSAWDLKPHRDLSDETPLSNHDNNVTFHFDDSPTLASKLRNRQIGGPPKSSQSPSATAAGEPKERKKKEKEKDGRLCGKNKRAGKKIIMAGETGCVAG